MAQVAQNSGCPNTVGRIEYSTEPGVDRISKFAWKRVHIIPLRSH